jgi:Acyl-protein synthetase, LuxE
MLQVDQASVDDMALVRRLLVAARMWSAAMALDLDSVAAVRNEMVLANHRRHLELIPSYQEIARETSVGADADFADLRERFLLTDGWFKGYDPGWLGGDFEDLTAWLGSISTLRASAPPAAHDLISWREGLRVAGVFVTVSSATTGRPSFVPRDRLTLAALRNSSGVRLRWSLPAGSYDALLLTPSGMGSGLQAGAAGFAGEARRTHRGDAGWLDFVGAALRDERPVVIYGPPSRLRSLLDTMGGDRLGLAPGSCVLTGGGWKLDSSGDIRGLLDHASDRFGVDRARCVDTYSTAELNTVFVSCGEGRYHVPPVVEAMVVDDLLRPVSGDADGRLAVIDPFAMSYPGRLATSDHVRLRHDHCPCGLIGQTLLDPITRSADAVPRGCGVVDLAGER